MTADIFSEGVFSGADEKSPPKKTAKKDNKKAADKSLVADQAKPAFENPFSPSRQVDPESDKSVKYDPKSDKTLTYRPTKASTTLMAEKSSKGRDKARESLMMSVLKSRLPRNTKKPTLEDYTRSVKDVIGIPTCAVVFEYLLGVSAFPCEKIVQLNGPPGSMKSSLAYEFIRWFYEAGGFGVYAETEHKWSSELANGIINPYDDPKRVPIVVEADSTESWQEIIIKTFAEAQATMDGTKTDPGLGKTLPVLGVVDSLAAALPREDQEKVFAQGHTARTHPVNAMLISKFVKSIANQMSGYPLSLVFVNHVTRTAGHNGIEVRSTSGGQAVSYQQMIDVESRKGRHIMSAEQGWEGHEIFLRTYKNSMASGDRRIATRIIWWWDDEGVQRFMWDWNWALVHLLTQNLSPIQKRRAEKFDLHCSATASSAVDNAAWSKNIGMSKSSEAVSWSELGQRMTEHPETMDKIRKVLAIRSVDKYSLEFSE